MSFPGLTIIGERINPGFAASRALLESHDLDSLARLAQEQVARGAAIININSGVAGERDPQRAAAVVRAVRSAVSVPLSIDSPDAAVQAAGLAAASGATPSLINSVTENRWELLELRRDHGAQVLFLVNERQENGRPVPNRSAEAVVDTARRVVARARTEHPDLANDAITLDVSVCPLASDTEGQARIAVTAIARLRQDPLLAGVHLSVGLSNLGILLPKRSLAGLPLGLALESAFLTRCVPLGLDRALATAGRAYTVLPEGHPALTALDTIIAADDPYEGLAALKPLLRACDPPAAASPRGSAA